MLISYPLRESGEIRWVWWRCGEGPSMKSHMPVVKHWQRYDVHLFSKGMLRVFDRVAPLVVSGIRSDRRGG